MTLTKREIFLLSLLLLLIIAYVYYQFLYRVVEERIWTVMSENKKLEKNILVQEASNNELKEIQSASAVLRQNYQQLLWRVPEEPCLPEIMDYITTASRQSFVQIIKFDYKYSKASGLPGKTKSEPGADPKSPAADYDSLELELEAEGEYDNLISFALQIENAPRLFRFSSLIVEPEIHDKMPQVEEKKPKEYASLEDNTELLTAGSKNPILDSEPDAQSAASSGTIKNGERLRLLLKFTAFYDQATAGGLSAENSELLQEPEEKASTE